MLAIIEAKNLIEAQNYIEVDVVYTTNLPQEIVDNVDKTVILITEANEQLTTLGNNDFYGMRRICEIQIFYKFDVDFSVENFEMRLMKLFKNNHWSVFDKRGHTLDPDTLQLTEVFYVAQEIII